MERIACGILLVLLLLFVIWAVTTQIIPLQDYTFKPTPLYKFGDIVIIYYSDEFRVGQIIEVCVWEDSISYKVKFPITDNTDMWWLFDEDDILLYHNSLLRQI